jgi:FkbM family methyltransferase
MLKFRENTIDSYIFHKIVHQNEYMLPEDLSNKIAIDIGSHIGSFSIACMLRNIEKVYAFEANKNSYEIAKYNIEKTGDNGEINHLAVWSESDTELSFTEVEFNTGMSKVENCNNENKVKTISLDDILKDIDKEIDILKIDCEGAEYPILYKCKNLNKIKNLAGEYHNIDEIYNGENLIKFLIEKGYFVISQYVDNAGIFFATKDIKESLFIIDWSNSNVSHKS